MYGQTERLANQRARDGQAGRLHASNETPTTVDCSRGCRRSLAWEIALGRPLHAQVHSPNDAGNLW